MAEPPTSRDGEPASVLVVEDEQTLADLYAAWLADEYDVQTAYDGQEALATLDETVDVVLLDRRMPGLSGDDVLEEVRDQGLDCRVVIVSAVAPDFDVIGMGFDDYLVKPVGADELHDAVERMLRRAGYDETMQEFQQLVATRGALEAQYGVAERQDNAAYARLQDRIASLQDEVDAAIAEFESADFKAAFRDLEGDDRSSDGRGGPTKQA